MGYSKAIQSPIVVVGHLVGKRGVRMESSLVLMVCRGADSALLTGYRLGANSPGQYRILGTALL